MVFSVIIICMKSHFAFSCFSDTWSDSLPQMTREVFFFLFSGKSCSNVRRQEETLYISVWLNIGVLYRSYVFFLYPQILDWFLFLLSLGGQTNLRIPQGTVGQVMLDDRAYLVRWEYSYSSWTLFTCEIEMLLHVVSTAGEVTFGRHH